jgi:hypothetical protein
MPLFISWHRTTSANECGMKDVILTWKYWRAIRRNGHDLCQHSTQTTEEHEGSGQDSKRGPLKHKSHTPPWANMSITVQITPRHRVLPEKLTCPQLVKKFPTFYGTQKFITVSTTALHLSLPWASSRYLRSTVILTSHLLLGLPSGLFPSDLPTKTLYAPLVCPNNSQLVDCTSCPT